MITKALFGFPRQMARADLTAFPRWYGARSMLAPAARAMPGRG